MNEFDELIFEDDGEVFDAPQEERIEEKKEEQPADTLTSDILRMRGINNPDKIKFEEDNGTIIERSWDSLSRDEQLNILTDQVPEDTDLDDAEVELINAIRQSGMSIDEYLKSLIPQQPQQYKIDQLSDEDVYALDLLEKVGEDNITEEEIQEAINVAKQNDQLFKKTVEGLRKEYVKLQQDEEARQYNEYMMQQQAQYNQFANGVLNEIRNLDTFAGQDLELSNEDAEELADFMLTLDENGTTAFGRALSDHKLYTEAAFWILNKDAIINELNEAIQNSYKKGYNAAKLEQTTNSSKSIKLDNRNFDKIDEDWS